LFSDISARLQKLLSQGAGSPGGVHGDFKSLGEDKNSVKSSGSFFLSVFTLLEEFPSCPQVSKVAQFPWPAMLGIGRILVMLNFPNLKVLIVQEAGKLLTEVERLERLGGI
jgi:hypothetical protein